ncbi:DEKNAAC104202 [Brettanomyces naardenensis]|uniref:GPN-loop GTPase 3 n=1 Tax=Brettanomyces naardenensis TaxID=13370 RepID=A0A448YPV0_BRENA|nr:DEKNAAC104202 [Brettanomyces naardenensis]
MSKVGVMVMGPAGVGKTTFCNSIMSYMESQGRTANLVNLDPAATAQEYAFTIDIRDLISLEDVEEELKLGPNGGLIYCFEFLLKNLDWLDEQIGDYPDDYLIFDCPGQIELYSHIPAMPMVVKHIQQQLNFNLCCTYLIEAPFVVDRAKFFSGALEAMSTMIFMELPHVNILSKMDLIKDTMSKREIRKFLCPDPMLLEDDEIHDDQKDLMLSNPKFRKLNKAIAQLVDDFGMVQFLPLDCSEKDQNESVRTIVATIDNITQWDENQEPKEPHDEEEEEDDEE